MSSIMSMQSMLESCFCWWGFHIVNIGACLCGQERESCISYAKNYLVIKN